ncbi:MAG: response regulator [Gemmatimonadaceae bacterium]|nr:response regulator [Gemmatimonadaceae bacterium]
MPSPAELNRTLATLRDRFAATAEKTTAALTMLADHLQRTPSSVEVVDALRRELHRVHGTAGSYGFHEVSRLAAGLELLATRWQADPVRDRDRRAAIVRQLVRALGAAFEAARGAGDDRLVHRILLVDVSEDTAAALIAEALHRGHGVERIVSGALETVLASGVPEVVIAGGDTLPALPEGVPVVLLGASELPSAGVTRVRLVDPGADAAEVVRVAESLAAQQGLAGASLVALAAGAPLTALLEAIGEREGMFVRVAADRAALFAQLQADPPALMLVDATGVGMDAEEAIQQVRGDRRFGELPILVVADGADGARREALFRVGADDFQPQPVVAVELTRRITRLLELRRQRQLARGIHPGTSLMLPERTRRSFEESLASAGVDGRAVALAVVRPRVPPAGLQGTALWHRECALLAAALAPEGARTGFVDETALGVLLPMDGGEAIARLDGFAEASEGEPTEWCVGIADRPADGDRGARTLVHLAEEAWQSARDAGERIHRWNTGDAGIAPDVVVVEDDPSLADLLGYALASRGLTHQVFSKGPEALAGLLAMRVRGRRPVVLMDIDLPGLDGFSLFERLRVDRPRDFRVVFVSVHASEGDQLRALRAGALDYIVKPVSLRVLMAKIAVWQEQDELA